MSEHKALCQKIMAGIEWLPHVCSEEGLQGRYTVQLEKEQDFWVRQPRLLPAEGRALLTSHFEDQGSYATLIICCFVFILCFSV